MDEALYSATYVDNYIDSVENLPDDVQRHLSRIRDIDVQYRSKFFEIIIFEVIVYLWNFNGKNFIF